MRIGQKIRERRLELNMTQEDLAKAMQYKSKSTINKIELGINDITLSKVVEFSKALHTTVAYLMDWTDESAPHTQVEIESYDPLKHANYEEYFKTFIQKEEIKELLQVYCALDPVSQKQVIDYAKFLLSQKG